MSDKSLGLLAIAILAMGLIAWFGQSTDDGEGFGDGPFFPQLQNRLDEVDRVVLRAGDLVTTLKREDDAWVVEERNGYPADFSRLANLMSDLASATRLEKKTARQENHAKLGLDTGATHVAVFAGEETLAECLAGDQAPTRAGRYVRRPDDDQVWLVDRLRNVQADPAGWIDNVVLNIDAEHVARVTHTNDEGELTVQRSEEGDAFEVVDMPADAELRYPTVTDSLSRALVNVRIEDVAAREASWQDPATAVFNLTDGSVVTVEARRVDDEFWLRIAVDASEDPSEAVQAVDRDLLARWQFEVAEHTWGQFTKSMDDMIKASAPDTAEAQ